VQIDLLSQTNCEGAVLSVQAESVPVAPNHYFRCLKEAALRSSVLGRRLSQRSGYRTLVQ
jgi:hypothetical protein